MPSPMAPPRAAWTPDMLTHGSMTGVDTNIILRAVLQDHEVQTAIAQRTLSGFSREAPGFISIVTLAEVYWMLARGRHFEKRACLAVIRRLVESETLEFDDGEGVVRAIHLAEDGADFADALIQSTMEQFGATETVTFDRSASERLGWRLLEE